MIAEDESVESILKGLLAREKERDKQVNNLARQLDQLSKTVESTLKQHAEPKDALLSIQKELSSIHDDISGLTVAVDSLGGSTSPAEGSPIRKAHATSSAGPAAAAQIENNGKWRQEYERQQREDREEEKRLLAEKKAEQARERAQLERQKEEERARHHAVLEAARKEQEEEEKRLAAIREKERLEKEVKMRVYREKKQEIMGSLFDDDDNTDDGIDKPKPEGLFGGSDLKRSNLASIFDDETSDGMNGAAQPTSINSASDKPKSSSLFGEEDPAASVTVAGSTSLFDDDSGASLNNNTFGDLFN